MRQLSDCAIHTYSHDLARPRRTLQETQGSSRQVSKKIKQIKQIQKNERKALSTLAVTSQCRTMDPIPPPGTGPMIEGKSDSEKGSWLFKPRVFFQFEFFSCGRGDISAKFSQGTRRAVRRRPRSHGHPQAPANGPTVTSVTLLSAQSEMREQCR